MATNNGLYRFHTDESIEKLFDTTRDLKNICAHRKPPLTVEEFSKHVTSALILMKLFNDHIRANFLLEVLRVLRQWKIKIDAANESLRVRLQSRLMADRGGRNTWGGTECIFSFQELSTRYGEAETLRFLNNEAYLRRQQGNTILDELDPLFRQTKETTGVPTYCPSAHEEACSADSPTLNIGSSSIDANDGADVDSGDESDASMGIDDLDS